MNKRENQIEMTLKLAKEMGVIRVKDATSRGIHPENLRRLCSKGLLTKAGYGIYSLTDADTSENITTAIVAKRMPNGIICLLSALRFHNIGTQNPPDVWVALKQNMAVTLRKELPVRIVRFSDASYSNGVETHTLDGVPVRITNPAKTVADCFKYRNKIGLDVALESLKECIRSRKSTYAEIGKYAKICRVANVMRPYMEAMQ